MIDKTEIKKFLITILKDNDVSLNEIDDNTAIVGENGLFFDSIDVLELIVELENKFKIKVKDNDIIKNYFKTFGTFYQFVIDNAK